jgi:hypothetical protein
MNFTLRFFVSEGTFINLHYSDSTRQLKKAQLQINPFDVGLIYLSLN